MRNRLTISILFLVTISLVMTGCLSGKSSNSGGGSNSNATLTSISVTPLAPTVAPGDTKQFTATGHYSDGSNQDITNSATWSSSTAGVATINPTTGLATAVDSGSATITATSNGVSGATSLNVAKLLSLSISPLDAKIDPTQTQQYTATANYDNNENKDVTSQATWTSSDITIATIDNTGKATGIKPGQVTITATFKGENAATQLTVNGVISVSVTPIGPGIHTPGVPPDTQQFKALAKFEDNSTLDVTNSATWASSDQTIATINSTGLATSVAEGQTEISATYLTVTGTTAMNVTTLTFSNADMSGDYVISLTGVDSRGTFFMVGTLNFDGNGTVTGTVDANATTGVTTNKAVHGKYNVFPDGRGDLQIFGSSVGTTFGHSLRFVLTANKTVGQAVEFVLSSISYAKIEKQSQACSSFGATDLQGAYAFGEGGFTPGGVASLLAEVGSYTVSSTLINGQADVNNSGTVTQLTLTGTVAQDAVTKCRYTVTVNDGTNTSQFAYYLVSPGSSSGKAYFVSIDPTTRPILGGLAEQQLTTTITGANYVFLTDAGGTEGEFHIAGQIGLSGGSVTGGEEDEAPLHDPQSAVTITGGTYTAGGAGGRFTLSETTSNSSNPHFVLYTVSSSRFFMMRTDSGTQNVAMGQADAQAATSIANGTYGIHLGYLNSIASGQADSGLLYLNVSGEPCNFCGIDDRNFHNTTISSLTLSNGTITNGPDSMGRGTFSLKEPGNVTKNYVFYAVSGSKVIVLGEDSNTDGTINLQ